VQELRTAIIDGESDIAGNIDDMTKDAIEATTLNSFINGLPSELLVRVKLEHPHTFKESISTAIQLSKTIETENIRKRTIFRPNFQPRADLPNNYTQPSRQNPVNSNADNRYRSGNGNTTSQPPFPSTPAKPIFPGQPQLNYQTKICRYCKTPGRLIHECRKLAYRKAQEGTQQPGNLGNAQGVPIRNDVRRIDLQPGRPTFHIQKQVLRLTLSFI